MPDNNNNAPREVVIGRNASSPIRIPDDRDTVSSRHVKITISPSGDWTLEDLESANGTYLRDENGQFVRVYNKHISESDIIRLGTGGASSFTFMAHRVMHAGESFAYEFRQLRHALRDHLEKEEKLEKRIEISGWVSSCMAGVVFLITWALGLETTVRFMLMSIAPILSKALFSGDTKALRAMRKKRERLFLCPNCGKPITPFDIEQGQCSRCKAK